MIYVGTGKITAEYADNFDATIFYCIISHEYDMFYSKRGRKKYVF